MKLGTPGRRSGMLLLRMSAGRMHLLDVACRAKGAGEPGHEPQCLLLGEFHMMMRRYCLFAPVQPPLLTLILAPCFFRSFNPLPLLPPLILLPGNGRRRDGKRTILQQTRFRVM
ncbi:hypothetical protein GQ53DRAFT_241241 [Thozetella sp. PMI_491]|nr:hypothetical protein GQ53DRAFT_241241 [Thozetella sp. PMI_491]